MEGNLFLRQTKIANPSKSHRSKGRPPKKIDLEKLEGLRNSDLSYRRLAKVMKISVKTVVK